MRTIQLTTSRLSLQEPSFEIVNEILHYLNANKEFHRPYEPIRPDEYYTKRFWENRILEYKKNDALDKNLQLFLIDSSQCVIGYTHFSNIVRGAFQACHLGFALSERKQGNGLMYEALCVAIQFIFNERNLHRIMANHLVNNIRSARLLNRLGFEKEGLAKQYLLINGEWQDHILTSLINKNWLGV